MVGGKPGHATCKILWLEVSQGMLPVNTVVGGKPGHATCKILWLGVSQGMLPVKYCGWG